jgi:hypothetical protein
MVRSPSIGAVKLWFMVAFFANPSRDRCSERARSDKPQQVIRILEESDVSQSVGSSIRNRVGILNTLGYFFKGIFA